MSTLLRVPAQKFGKSVLKSIYAREVIDSRGNPTVETEVTTDRGVFQAMVPSGASTGIFEALELRDKDKGRYGGKGVLKAVQNVNDVIGPSLLNHKDLNWRDLKAVDKFMVETLDGTKNEWGWTKSKLGANAILSVSMALSRAIASAEHKPLYQYYSELAGYHNPSKFVLPVPSFNVINGGQHSGNALPHQEFMIMPIGAETFKEAMRMGCETYQVLKGIIKKKYGSQSTAVGDEGGFAPDISTDVEALDLVSQAIKEAGYEGKVAIAMDIAASEIFDEKTGMYNLDFKNPKATKPRLITGQQLLETYLSAIQKYHVVSIEDPFDQQDFDSYAKLTKAVGDKVQIVGDDLLVTNPTRIKLGIEKKACNALLLKVNQIGSISESIQACEDSKKAGWGVMVSHRSGETEDSTIADLVVGLRTGQIKSGAPCRSERLAKYNQLIRIEDELKGKALYAGKQFRNGFKL